MPLMDRATAAKILANCERAYEPLNAILLDRSPNMSDEQFSFIRRQVADTLAHMFDLLIEPVITEYPDLNPYS